jgi:hypothetical protein
VGRRRTDGQVEVDCRQSPDASAAVNGGVLRLIAEWCSEEPSCPPPRGLSCARIVHDTVVAAGAEVPAQLDFDGARLDDQLRSRSKETPRHQVVRIVWFDGGWLGVIARSS